MKWDLPLKTKTSHRRQKLVSHENLSIFRVCIVSQFLDSVVHDKGIILCK